MGACCSSNSDPKHEANLQKRYEHLDEIPATLIIKCQAMIRGFLARRRVKNTFGYEMSPNLISGKVKINIDPA